MQQDDRSDLARFFDGASNDLKGWAVFCVCALAFSTVIALCVTTALIVHWFEVG